MARIILGNLTPKLMKIYSWGMILTQLPIEFLIKGLTVEIFVYVTFDESNLPKADNDSASDVDRLTTELEDLDLLKDDEAIPEPTIVEQDAPEAAEELPKE